MSTSHDPDATQGDRHNSFREEQAFCRRALESGAYDSMSDQAWVALCEQIATEARQIAEQGADEASPITRPAHRGQTYVP